MKNRPSIAPSVRMRPRARAMRSGGAQTAGSGQGFFLGGSSNRGRARCGRFGGTGSQLSLARARKAEELSLPLFDELRVEGTHELLLKARVLGGVIEGGTAGDRVALLR